MSEPKKPYLALVVDDELDNIELVGRALHNNPRVSSLRASSGKEAIAQYQSHNVDILIVDQRMPGMTGAELIRRLRTRDRPVHAIMVTAFAEDDEVVALQKEQLVHCVVRKPWTESDLSLALDVVITVLDRREA